MIYKTVENNQEIVEILDLQRINLLPNLKPDDLMQGFLTVSHTEELLTKMNAAEPSIIAKQENTLAGFCLAMTKDFRNDIPILIPMFDLFDELTYHKSLSECNYIVVGQVCVAQKFRGKGIFDGMYEAFKDQYKSKYDFAITEIAKRNTRSFQAHLRVGFPSAEAEA